MGLSKYGNLVKDGLTKDGLVREMDELVPQFHSSVADSGKNAGILKLNEFT